MKNQYFGDENDYLKYGLLRCCALSGWNVGVCWMLTPSDGRNDGAKTGYLQQSAQWRRHDPVLFDLLNKAILVGERRVAFIEQSDGIPGARYFSKIIPDNEPQRSHWFDEAISSLRPADLIFFDPDNGLEVPSTPRGRSDSSKYLYWSEVESAWRRGVSLLLFQHFARENRDAHVARLEERLRIVAGSEATKVFRTSYVAYLLAVQPEHVIRLAALTVLLDEHWSTRIWQQTTGQQIDRTPRPNTGFGDRRVEPSKSVRLPAQIGSLNNVIMEVGGLSAHDVARKRVLCPSCRKHVFQMWPFGWDSHAARCAGLLSSSEADRKAEFKTKFNQLFR